MDTVVKYLTVAIFAIILYFVVGFIVIQIQAAINLDQLAPTVKYYLCSMGIFEAINIYFSLLIASWFSNKLLNYISG